MDRSVEKIRKKSKTMRNPQVISLTFVRDDDEARTNEASNLIAQMILLGREKFSKNKPDPDKP